MKKIIIGSDKSGFQLKEAVKAHLVEAGYEVTDAGSQSEENAMFYYEAAENVQFAKHPALNIAYPGVVLAGAIFLGHVLPVIDHDAKRFRLCRRAPMHKERQRQQEKEKREQAHLSHRKYLNHFL